MSKVALAQKAGLNRILVLSSGCKANAAAQLDLVRAARHRANRENTRRIDDPAAMYTDKSGGIESLSKMREAFRKKIVLRPTVQLNIVICRLYPFDGIHSNQENMQYMNK